MFEKIHKHLSERDSDAFISDFYIYIIKSLIND
jgi:hypothetical protein